jgi:hypothetical protein
MTWREKCKRKIIDDFYEIEIRATEKGGVFKSNTILGEGTINLL